MDNNYAYKKRKMYWYMKTMNEETDYKQICDNMKGTQYYDWDE